METLSTLNIKCSLKGNKVLNNIDLNQPLSDFLSTLSQEIGNKYF